MFTYEIFNHSSADAFIIQRPLFLIDKNLPVLHKLKETLIQSNNHIKAFFD